MNKLLTTRNNRHRHIASKKTILSTFVLLITVVVASSTVITLYMAQTAKAVTAYPYAEFIPDRMSAGISNGASGVGGSVCVALSATDAAVDQVILTLPNGDNSTTGFTVNTTGANWAIDTTDIPTQASPLGNTYTAWPLTQSGAASISQSSSSGGAHTITWNFTPGSLTLNIPYCFHFAGSNTLGTRSTAFNGAPGCSTASCTPSIEVKKSSGATQIFKSYIATATVGSGGTGDQVTVTGEVAPTFTLSIGSGSVALGNISSSAVTSGSADTVTVSTNAKNGWQAWVKDANNGTLTSATSGTPIAAGGTFGSSPYSINNSSGGFGLDADVGSGASIQTEYNAAATEVGTLQNTFKLVAYGAAATSGDTFDLVFKSRVPVTQPPAYDYTDTVTLVAAGAF